ncbi:hypothetical protein SNE40_001417 [Patella caerulea]|uniref:Major facilitator superfamily (MFS) profile domain-containing protein n=1 Tax=Patella caerulea TaxID=87958 RepID=A0AAN8KHG3_PATCE
MSKIKPWAWVVLAASFLALFFNSSLNYSVGVLHIALLERFPEEEVTTISWLGALFSSMFALAGWTGSILVSTFNARVCVMLSGLVTLIGFVLSSLVVNMKYLFITYSLIAGTGQAMCYSGTLITLGYYFKEKTGMASGIALSGCGLCTFVFPPLSQFLIETYGLDGAFLLLGALGFQASVCGALMRPTEYEIRTNRKLCCNKNSNSVSKPCNNPNKRNWRDKLKFCKSLPFFVFLISSVSFNMAQSTVYLFLPDYFVHLGSSPQEAAFAISLAGITGILSRVLVGFLVTLVDTALVYGSSFGIFGVITVFLKYMTTLGSKLTYTSLFGIYMGGCWTLHYTLLVDIVGLYDVSAALGISMMACGGGYLIGPPIAEMFVLEFGDYYYAFAFTAAFFLLASTTGFAVRAWPKKIDVLEVEINEEIQTCMIANTDGES